MSLFKKVEVIKESVDVEQLTKEVLEKLKKTPAESKRLLQDLPVTIDIVWKDKQKGLILCNACSGKGIEIGSYGIGHECRFCEGKKVIRLKAK